jgi:hypothetical protein
MTNSTQPKKPTLIAYQVREIREGNARWTPIGAAWANKDGGFTVVLESYPIDGRIVCSPNKVTSA